MSDRSPLGWGLRGRRIPVLAACILALGVGCKSKESPKAPPPPKARGPSLPPGVAVYSSAGKLWRLQRGSQPGAIATGAYWFPAVNAEGTEVAYWEDRGGGMAMMVMNLVSHAAVRIGEWQTLGPLGRNLNLRNAPAWVPGRDALVFADGRQIWQADADGSNLQTIHEHPGGGCYSVTPSPDGTRVAYVAVSEKEQNLWTFSLQSRKAQAITEYTSKEGAVGAPAWSPKDGFILFVLYKAEEANVWRIPVDGGTAMPVTREGRTNAPAWDPTGHKIAVSSGNQNPLLWQIHLLNAEDGKFLEQLTNTAAGAFAPSISGDW